jgi:hypothetical protein
MLTYGGNPMFRSDYSNNGAARLNGLQHVKNEIALGAADPRDRSDRRLSARLPRPGRQPLRGFPPCSQGITSIASTPMFVPPEVVVPATLIAIV